MIEIIFKKKPQEVNRIMFKLNMQNAFDRMSQTERVQSEDIRQNMLEKTKQDENTGQTLYWKSNQNHRTGIDAMF